MRAQLCPRFMKNMSRTNTRKINRRLTATALLMASGARPYCECGKSKKEVLEHSPSFTRC